MQLEEEGRTQLEKVDEAAVCGGRRGAQLKEEGGECEQGGRAAQREGGGGAQHEEKSGARLAKEGGAQLYALRSRDVVGVLLHRRPLPRGIAHIPLGHCSSASARGSRLPGYFDAATDLKCDADDEVAVVAQGRAARVSRVDGGVDLHAQQTEPRVRVPAKEGRDTVRQDHAVGSMESNPMPLEPRGRSDPPRTHMRLQAQPATPPTHHALPSLHPPVLTRSMP
jgi:hypothetical protein